MRPASEVRVAWMRGADVSGVFMDSMLRLQEAWCGLSFQVLEKGGGLLAAGRNNLIRDFITDGRHDWLLLLDSDMEVTVEAVNDLLALTAEHKIIAGLCFGWDRHKRETVPVLQRFIEPRKPEAGFRKVTRWTPGETIAVDAAGGAVILIHRDVLETVADHAQDRVYPWFREGELGGQPVGEDLIFWLRVRAAGFTPVVPTRYSFGHDKSIIVDHHDWPDLQPNR